MTERPILGLYGFAVVVTPDLPKMQLSPRVCEVLAADFIAETNAWLLDFFGTKNSLADYEVRVSELLGTIWMNPRTYALVREAVPQQ